MRTMTVEANPWPKKLKALRKRLGLTLEQAAEKVGVQPRTWYAWETPSQKRRPPAGRQILIRLLAEGKL